MLVAFTKTWNAGSSELLFAAQKYLSLDKLEEFGLTEGKVTNSVFGHIVKYKI